MASTAYKTDIVAWANEQAALIRMGKIDQMDLEHIAEEIEDVGKSEQRELESRMAVLLAHLLKWQYQPDRQSASWQRTIKEQRKRVLIRLKQTPSLKNSLSDPDWLASAWSDAITLAIDETGIVSFPDDMPWSVEQVLANDFLPDSVI
jgi:Domain of unknown function DUF29